VALARVVCNLALRKLGVVGSGRDARASDMVDTLNALRSMYLGWVASGASGRLVDVVITEDYCARPNERVIRESESACFVSLPQISLDGSWRHDFETNSLVWDPIWDDTGAPILDDYGNEILADPVPQIRNQGCIKPPRDGSAVTITDLCGGRTQTYLYDGTVKMWQTIDGLTLDDEAPRSYADLNGLASCLAIEISDQFGSDIPEATAVASMRFKTSLVTRFGMERSETVGVYF